MAASSCSSPSIIRSGYVSFAILVASTTLSTSACLALPLLECESIATLGSSLMKNFHDSAEPMAISESSSALGSMLRPQSASSSVPSSPYSSLPVHMMKKADTSLVPGAVLRICSAGRRVLAVEWQAPETRPSASPILTIMVA